MEISFHIRMRRNMTPLRATRCRNRPSRGKKGHEGKGSRPVTIVPCPTVACTITIIITSDNVKYTRKSHKWTWK